MGYRVYILRSSSSGRHYCGYSADVPRRVLEHNDDSYVWSKTTKRFAGPWELLWTSEELSRSEAMVMERRIKKRGIARYLTAQEAAESRRRRD